MIRHSYAEARYMITPDYASWLRCHTPADAADARAFHCISAFARLLAADDISQRFRCFHY